MKSFKQMSIICAKCGNPAPKDKERSTENWDVYDTSKPCGKCNEKDWIITGLDDSPEGMSDH